MLSVSSVSSSPINYHSQSKEASSEAKSDGSSSSASNLDKPRTPKPKASAVSKRDSQEGAIELKSTLMGPPSKKRKNSKEVTDQCVGTSFGTLTEPECLGPCEPGTSVNLDGIVWHETEDGILVVNATWRGRSYIGTLLDSTRHDWAPPRPNDGNEDWDCRTRAGRAKRRSAAFTPEVNNSLNSKQRAANNTRSRTSRDETGTPLKGIELFSFPESPRPDNGKLSDVATESMDAKESQSLLNPITGLHVEIVNKNSNTVAPCTVSPILLECPEENCNKKYRHANGLRYHQSRAHGSDVLGEEDDSFQSSDADYESAAVKPIVEEVADTQKSPSKIKAKELGEPKQNPLCDNQNSGQKPISPDAPLNGETKKSLLIDSGRDSNRSPAYSDISDDSFSTSDFIDHLLETKLLDSKKSQDQLEKTSNSFAPFNPSQKIYQFENTSQLLVVDKNTSHDQFPPLEKEKPQGKPSPAAPFLELPGQGAATNLTFINPYNTNIPSACDSIQALENMNSGKPLIDQKAEDTNTKNKTEKSKSPTILSEQSLKDIGPTSTSSTRAKITKVLTTESLQPWNSLPATLQSQKFVTSKQQVKQSSKSLDKKASKRDKEVAPNRSTQQHQQQTIVSAHQQYPKSPAFQTTFPPIPATSQNHFQHHVSNMMNPPLPPNPQTAGKDMEPIKIKQEPKTESPTDRPSSTIPQFLPPSPYMPPGYGYNPPPSQFSPYSSNLVSNPSFATSPGNPSGLSRYHMPDLSPMSASPTQNYPNSVYAPTVSNVPDSLGFMSPQTPPGLPGSSGCPSNTAPPNSKTSPQTHFHTHHHTHVGLGYPLYPTPYEAVISGQQVATPIITPFTSPQPPSK